MPIIEVVLFIVSTYGFMLMSWEWHRIGRATEIYRYILLLFFGLMMGSGLHIFVDLGKLPRECSSVTPLILLAAMVPMCYRWTRRAWLFRFSSEKELQQSLDLAICPILGKYCRPLGEHKKKEKASG